MAGHVWDTFEPRLGYDMGLERALKRGSTAPNLLFQTCTFRLYLTRLCLYLALGPSLRGKS